MVGHYPLQFIGGDVDHEMLVAQIVGHPAPALHVEDDLLAALFWRNVHGDNGLFAEQALGLEAVAHLEFFDGCGQSAVIGVGTTFGSFIVAGEGEEFPHLAHTGIGLSGL